MPTLHLYSQAGFKPTAAHSFIAELERRGLLLHHYTTNIDGLETAAGGSCVTHAHGTLGACSN